MPQQVRASATSDDRRAAESGLTCWHRELGSLVEMPRYPAAAEPEFRILSPESDGAGPCPALPGVGLRALSA